MEFFPFGTHIGGPTLDNPWLYCPPRAPRGDFRIFRHVQQRAEPSEGPYILTEVSSGKPECVKLPGRRPEDPETTAKMTSQRNQCGGAPGALTGMRPASEREQADRRLGLAWFGETKIAPVVGREVCVDEIIQRLTDGFEVSFLLAWQPLCRKPCLGDGSWQPW